MQVVKQSLKHEFGSDSVRSTMKKATSAIGRPEHLLILLRALVLRDFRGHYKRTVLGPLGAVLPPLFDEQEEKPFTGSYAVVRPLNHVKIS